MPSRRTSRPDPAYWKLRKLLGTLKYGLPKKAGSWDKSDEANLILAWQQHRDSQALLALIEMHAGFIRMIAWRAIPRRERLGLRTTEYRGGDTRGDTTHVSAHLEDYMQEAYIGFARAVTLYDFEHESGAKLISYAGYWIQSFVARAVRRERVMYMGGHGSRYRVKTVRLPRIGSISQRESPSRALLRVGGYECMHPERVCILRDVAAKGYQTAQAVMDPREFDIWRRRWFVPYVEECGEQPSLQVLGDEYGLSRERVRQIEVVAFRKLRKALDTSDLPPVWQPSYKRGRLTEDRQHEQVYLQSHRPTGPDNVVGRAIDDWIVIGERTG